LICAEAGVRDVIWITQTRRCNPKSVEGVQQSLQAGNAANYFARRSRLFRVNRDKYCSDQFAQCRGMS
jgi:hypothetical protein